MTNQQPGPGDGRPPREERRTGRRVTRREAAAVAVVAVIALGLGVYLLAEPADTAGGAAAAVSTTQSSARSTTQSSPSTTQSSPPPTLETAPTAAPTPAAPTPAAQDGVAQSAVQPPGMGGDDLGGPIGPIGDLARRIPGDPLAKGDVDAPLVMVMFSDYRCPFCAKFSRDLEQPLIDEYVTTGQMRLEWRDLPIFGEQSVQAAVAGRAAARQGKFWEFNAALYRAAPPTGHPEFTTESLVDFARQAGVANLARFRADLDDPALRSAVAEDADQGAILGVPSTPAFVVNGYPMLGAQPIEKFEQLIDTVAGLQ